MTAMLNYSHPSMMFLLSFLVIALSVYSEAKADDGSEVCPAKRTLLSITWSCILTVIICAWTSVHPNVPPRDQGRALLGKVKMMFWSIIAPELILAWAVRQWFAAREVRDSYNRVYGECHIP